MKYPERNQVPTVVNPELWSGTLDEYWGNIHQEQLSSEELSRLLKLAQSAHLECEQQEAVMLLIQRNMRLVIKCIQKYLPMIPINPNNTLFLEAVLAGAEGLAVAVKKFKSKHGTAFSTFATWCIRGELTRYKRTELETVDMPYRVQDKITRLSEIEYFTYANDKTDPVSHEGTELVVTHYNRSIKDTKLSPIDAQDVLEIRAARKQLDPLSLDGELQSNQGALEEYLLFGDSKNPVELTVFLRERQRFIDALLAQLTPEEELIVRLHLQFPVLGNGEVSPSFKAISEHLGYLYGYYVSKIYTEAIAKLQQYLTSFPPELQKQMYELLTTSETESY